MAILRGGGCSFGIKVINAQKLGAVAVIIVNTDDKKTMRLMALADEAPLIKVSDWSMDGVPTFTYLFGLLSYLLSYVLLIYPFDVCTTYISF